MDDVIDRIYEAPFRPELWPRILDDLSGIADARGGVFFAANTRVLNWTASAPLLDTFTAYVNDGWLRRCTRRACWLTETRPSFLVEHDIWTTEELEANPVYRDFLRPQGLGWSAGMALPLPSGDRVVFTLEREYGRGPVEAARIAALNALRPHLARAALLAARMRLQAAEAAGVTLAALGLPALVLDAAGAAVSANALMDGLAVPVAWRAQGRVALELDKAADRLLAEAVAGLGRAGAAAVRSFAVRGADGAPAVVAHVLPLRGAGQDVFSRGAALVVFTPLVMPDAPPSDLIRSLFDLTPAEARVACGLTAGEDLDRIAARGGTSRTTVRTQLRGVLHKTGCTRQAEVAALLSGVGAIRIPPH